MKINLKHYALLATVLCFVQVHLAYADYRLAFSRTENIEVFVEDKNADNWCSEALKLRVQYSKAVDAAAWARLMPKIGSLLAGQCDKAQQVQWRSLDAAGNTVAQGKSSAADKWQVIINDTPATEIAGSTSANPAPQGAPPSNNFVVAGWTLPNNDEQSKLTAFLRTLTDQHGCKIISWFEPGIEDYLTIRTEGLKCGADGYAQGKGVIALETLDGSRILRSDYWFSHGLIFERDNDTKTLSPDKIVLKTEDSSIAWFYFGSNQESRSHYFLRAQWVKYGDNGDLPVLSVNKGMGGVFVYVLTDNEAMFDRENTIALRKTIDNVLSSLAKNTTLDTRSAQIIFTNKMDSLRKNTDGYGLSNQDLYGIYATKYSSGRWSYSLDRADNYLLTRKKREVAEKRRAEELAERQRQSQLREQARKEQQNLERYQMLSAYSLGDLRKELEQDISFTNFITSIYSQLMQGGEDKIRRIVRISGSTKADALVDLPYPMQIQGQAARSKGWYLLEGKRRLDVNNLDKDDLPMVQVTVDEQGILQPCQQAGCLELLNPLSLLRLQVSNPEWTAEAANALIDSANNL